MTAVGSSMPRIPYAHGEPSMGYDATPAASSQCHGASRGSSTRARTRCKGKVKDALAWTLAVAAIVAASEVSATFTAAVGAYELSVCPAAGSGRPALRMCLRGGSGMCATGSNLRGGGDDSSPPPLRLDNMMFIERGIATVEHVKMSSPAEDGGLEAGDVILQVGTLRNIDGLGNRVDIIEAILEQVVSNKDKKLPLRARGLDGSVRDLVITPHAWDGDGLLGCCLLAGDDALLDVADTEAGVSSAKTRSGDSSAKARSVTAAARRLGSWWKGFASGSPPQSPVASPSKHSGAEAVAGGGGALREVVREAVKVHRGVVARRARPLGIIEGVLDAAHRCAIKLTWFVLALPLVCAADVAQVPIDALPPLLSVLGGAGIPLRAARSLLQRTRVGRTAHGTLKLVLLPARIVWRGIAKVSAPMCWVAMQVVSEGFLRQVLVRSCEVSGGVAKDGVGDGLKRFAYASVIVRRYLVDSAVGTIAVALQRLLALTTFCYAWVHRVGQVGAILVVGKPLQLTCLLAASVLHLFAPPSDLTHPLPPARMEEGRGGRRRRAGDTQAVEQRGERDECGDEGGAGDSARGGACEHRGAGVGDAQRHGAGRISAQVTTHLIAPAGPQEEEQGCAGWREIKGCAGWRGTEAGGAGRGRVGDAGGEGGGGGDGRGTATGAATTKSAAAASAMRRYKTWTPNAGNESGGGARTRGVTTGATAGAVATGAATAQLSSPNAPMLARVSSGADPLSAVFEFAQAFEVQAPPTQDGHRLAILGSHPLLGEWQVDKAITLVQKVMLQQNKRVWSLSVKGLPKGQQIEYKYLLLAAKGGVVAWEAREGNRNLIFDGSEQQVQHDYVDSYHYL